MTEGSKTKSAAALRRFVFLTQWRLSEMFAFSLIFTLGALILIIHLATWGVEARKDAKFLVETSCVVESATIRPDPAAPQERFRPEATIRYELKGETFTTTTYDRLTLTDDKGFTYDRESALEAIRGARESGHMVFLCSGRNLSMLQPLLKFGFDGAVASSGGYVFTGDQLLFDCPMTSEQQQLAMYLFKENGIL